MTRIEELKTKIEEASKAYGEANPITNLMIDNSYSLLSTEGFASKVDFDLHAGAEFTIGNNATLNIGTFTQTIGTYTRRMFSGKVADLDIKQPDVNIKAPALKNVPTPSTITIVKSHLFWDK